ncbi:hypothetical protein [Yinghuangia seranimata]|uniref:hypothetical protein n=1 Tax=Yinghuangia seranimata TaxID=408067 RepID=UPI00248CA457|nr:hypothetical protein [Yinghuangia seranimata]MDI2129918.1 hypothetical protein [Yinghuangia seranimata]
MFEQHAADLYLVRSDQGMVLDSVEWGGWVEYGGPGWGVEYGGRAQRDEPGGERFAGPAPHVAPADVVELRTARGGR